MLTLSRLAPVAALFLAMTAPTLADDLYGEQVHSDSFGNLVVYSPAGYKRIVVGQGYLAPAMSEATGSGEPSVAYNDSESRSGCRREPMMWHGRSRMYGLPDHVVPTPGWRCRN